MNILNVISQKKCCNLHIVKMFKKQTYFSFFACIVLALFVLNACEEENTTAEKSNIIDNEHDLPAILKRGKLVVLAENSSTSFFIYKGKKMGFEYELLREFAEDLGISLEVKILTDLDEMTNQLNAGQGDVLACNISVTRDRQDNMLFSTPFFQTNQVLIQRKEGPDNHAAFITDPIQLAKKKVSVWKHSSYFQRLMNLQDEIGDTIYIHPTQGHQGVEELIELVSDGQIDYTVAEKNIAMINNQYYDNIDANLAISFKQNIAFALPKDAPLLKKRLDKWLKKFMQKETFAYIKRKYFEQTEQIKSFQDEHFSSKRGAISPFDNLLRAEAVRYGIDWRFVAAIMYNESGFDPKARGFGGAYGLWQFMPGTGPHYGVHPSSPADVQIRGGMKFINKLNQLYKHIPDKEERYKFILASYNAGTGHMRDAIELAKKRGLNPNKWENNVELMVKNLGKHQYYGDKVVKSGSFRGRHAVHYVKKVLDRYQLYKTLAKN